MQFPQKKAISIEKIRFLQKKIRFPKKKSDFHKKKMRFTQQKGDFLAAEILLFIYNSILALLLAVL